MTKANIPEKYQPIWQKAVPYLRQARQGDLEHCRQAAEEVYRLSKGKSWDLDVLIPVAMFHDIGHAAVLPEHFWMITGPKKLENSKLVHMLTGAKIAHDILSEVNWPKEKIKEVVDLISIHDNKDKSLLDTEEKKVFNDIDKLDRFTESGFEAVLDEFNLSPKEAYVLLKDFMSQIVLPENCKIAETNLEILRKKYHIN